MPTVASVSWQADRILRRIVPPDEDEEWRADLGGLTMREVVLPDSWVGERYTRLERESGVRLAFVTRYGEGLIPDADTVVQADDIVHVLIDPARRDDHLAVFTRGPEAH